VDGFSAPDTAFLACIKSEHFFC